MNHAVHDVAAQVPGVRARARPAGPVARDTAPLDLALCGVKPLHGALGRTQFIARVLVRALALASRDENAMSVDVRSFGYHPEVVHDLQTCSRERIPKGDSHGSRASSCASVLARSLPDLESEPFFLDRQANSFCKGLINWYQV